jgi:hypothetical protein
VRNLNLSQNENEDLSGVLNGNNKLNMFIPEINLS